MKFNTLYVVPTPIGNLKDFSSRAKEVLSNVPVIYTEDTRHSQQLTNYLHIKPKLISLHKFNETKRIHDILSQLKATDAALISDAGTPTISDPGQYLINILKKSGVNIIPLPGPTAITTALSASGLLFNSFSFVGFLPRKEQQIIKVINDHLYSDVIVSYESPKRIKQTLEYIKNNIGDISVSLARELTKIYEEIQTKKISELLERKEYKGEIVLMIPTKNILPLDKNLEGQVRLLKEGGMNDKSIINFLTKTTEFKKNDIYEMLKK